MNSTPLESLLLRVSLRNRRAFSLLYDQTCGTLFAICLRVLKDRHEAEEALQDTYLKIWNKADSFTQGKASAQAWLVTIARNAAIDRLRRMKLQPDVGETIHRLEDRSASPEDNAIYMSEIERLQECLGELEPNQADLIRQAFFSGGTYAQVADSIGKPLGTVKSWIRRSLIKLRNCLGAPVPAEDRQ